MNGYNKKEEVKLDMCKSHTARSDRELYRVCPSKLSKKELEDLYFTLLEKNLELKKTVTGQQDQIKVLSTKVQRMTATQKNNVAREKDCCTYTKALVNEQKESIADLKRANERMSERIRVLNMRLCSAKQFLRRSPATSASRCTKCSAPPMSLKNSSVTILHTKMSDSNVKTAVSNHGLDKDIMLSTRTVETETEEPEKENLDRLCNENRCRSLMEELKRKIVDLQEELSKTHNEYSTRISRLEAEVTELRAANDHERARRAASDHRLEARSQHADQLAARLRDAEAKYGKLSTELSIEKRKVVELETRVKAADRASIVSKTIQEHLSNTNQIKAEIVNQQPEPAGSPDSSPRWDKSSPRLEVPCETPVQPSEATDRPCTDKDEATEKADQHRLSKLSNDSGYIEAYKSPKADDEKKNKETNEELKHRISQLQEQMNQLLTAMKTGMVPTEPPISKAADDNKSMHSDGDESRVMVASTINAGNVPFSDSYVGKTLESASILRMPSSYVNPKPDDMMTFLDNDVNANKAEKITDTGEVNKLYDNATKNTTTLDKMIKNEAALHIVDIDKAVKDSFANKDLKPVRSDLIEEPNTQNKDDNHNRFQIPGPLPVDNIFKVPDRIIDKFKNKPNTVKCKKQSKDPAIKAKEAKLKGVKVKKNDRVQNQEEVDENLNLKPISVDDNIEVHRETKVRISNDSDVCPAKAPIAIGSLTEKYIENEVDKMVTSSVIIPPNPDQSDEEDNRIGLCLHHTRVCTCDGAKRRDISMFRTCSGTLRFHTTPAATGPAFKRCGCAARHDDCTRSGDVHENCDQVTQTALEPPAPTEGFRQRSATYSKGQTYPIPPHSPDNTDCEISSLTDLPSEKDGKSPRDALSPGEEKATSTYTDTYTHTTTEYSNLSEGELPGAGGAPNLSYGETKVDSGDKKQAERSTSASRQSARMEQALAAITEELALCRELLRARRASEPKPLSKDASLTVDLCPGPIALKKAAGSPRIGDAFTPKCIFTLHIGTVVLSDEAVINSRGMSLVLTWKFYDQNMTMTRMRTGRVVLYDFSTEYDVKITDHFLNYLKHENMQIIISELDNQGKPFASCALPLRDALLHTNRRADMSLALVAGPNLRHKHDALDSGDEVGVLDLWCMLRVDPSLLPAINRAIARSSPPNLTLKDASRPSTCMAQLMEDDRYNDDHISQDLEIRPSSKQKTSLYDYKPENSSMKNNFTGLYDFEIPKSLATKQRSDNLYDLSRPIVPPARNRSVASQIQEQTESTNTPPIPETRRSVASQISSPSCTQRSHHNLTRMSLQRSQVGFRDADVQSIHSRIIANEVPAKIRSAYDMKQALDRNALNTSPMQRLGKVEEDAASQTHSTASYWRRLVTRRQAPKSAKKSKSFCKKECSLTSLMKKERSNNMSSRGVHLLRSPSTDVEEPPELTRSSKGQNGSKKSVTIAKYNERNKAWARENKILQDLPLTDRDRSEEEMGQSVEITVMWLALNEECDAMVNPSVQRLYVAYTFLGRSGAELETPVSLPKPKSYVDKCYFQFTKKFQLSDCDLPLLGHMARCRSKNRTQHSSKDCAIFTVISEPPEDPLGLDSCEDIGYAYLYFGDLLAYSAGNDSYIEVVPVQSAQVGEAVCGVLAVKVDGLDVLRRCTLLATSQRDLGLNMY